MNRPHSIKYAILKRIEDEKLAPTSAWRFMIKDTAIAILWLITVCIGASAVAVSLFAFAYQRYSLYEATHESWLAFLIDQLPLLWLLALSVSVLLAAYYLKHFRRGYRYSLPMLLFSSASVSVLAGVILHSIGFGYMIDNSMGGHMPLYTSIAQEERLIWQRPSAGRLIGTHVHNTTGTSSIIIFEDIEGMRWQMDISELVAADMELLTSQQHARVIGFVNNEVVHSFHACGVFAWMGTGTASTQVLAKERSEFVRRIYQHDVTPSKRRIIIERTITDGKRYNPNSRCSELPALKRIQQSMR